MCTKHMIRYEAVTSYELPGSKNVPFGNVRDSGFFTVQFIIHDIVCRILFGQTTTMNQTESRASWGILLPNTKMSKTS